MIESMAEFLAQATEPGGPGGPAPPGGGSPRSNPFGTMMWGLILAIVVFYVVLFRGQGRRQKQMNKLIQALKKNDRVVTIGGIVGTVVSTRDDEVVLRVDEASNTRLTFQRKAVQRVITDEPADKG